MAGVRLSGWSEIERGGVRCRCRSYAVVVGAMPSSLRVNIPDWSKRERTDTGRRERELESEREEKRKHEERRERNRNIK